jgi:hypothetical protein
MSQTIVCGVDGSELGTGAAAVASALAGRLELAVVFID